MLNKSIGAVFLFTKKSIKIKIHCIIKIESEVMPYDCKNFNNACYFSHCQLNC